MDVLPQVPPRPGYRIRKRGARFAIPCRAAHPGRDISKAWAHARRTRLVNHAPYQANAFLAKALKKLSKDKFNHMIVFLGWEDGERTNDHVERNNRSFRLMQKTHYKRRKTHTIEKALELELYARMLAHPLYSHNVRQVPTVSQKTTILPMAA
jgi:hypothetical protein